MPFMLQHLSVMDFYDSSLSASPANLLGTNMVVDSLTHIPFQVAIGDKLMFTVSLFCTLKN